MSASLLVTGGAGFIGSHLLERLAQRGYQLVCLDNFDPYYPATIKRQNLGSALIDGRVRLVEADIRDTEALRRIFANGSFQAVIHLAARPGVLPSLADPSTYMDVNLGGTLNLLELSREFTVQRFIFGSSSSVYGLMDGAAAREDFTSCRPLSPYGASKVAAEALCSAYAQALGLTVVALRFFTVYGPRQRPDMAISRFTDLIARGQEVPLYGDGDSVRDYTFVTDVVQGVESALTQPLDGFQVFNLGCGRPVALRRLVGLVEESLGMSAKLKLMPAQPGVPPGTWADVAKARAILDYRPSVAIEEGVDRYVRWFRQRASLAGRHAIAHTEAAAPGRGPGRGANSAVTD